MGTDIHVRVEARWKSAHAPTATSLVRWTAVCPPPIPADDRYGCPVYEKRNYALFSFLSGVRYGCSMDHLIPERGLPPDMDVTTGVSEFWSTARSGVAEMRPVNSREDGEAPWVGDYGHTWATVGELLDLPWSNAVTHYGDGAPNGEPMDKHCADFIQWLNVLNDWWGRENCRVIWGFDS